MTKPHESAAFDKSEFYKLKKLVAQGEGLTLEFKRKASYPEKIVREMIAFANTAGGTVLLGVDDDGSIPGLKHADGEAHVIHKALECCRPSLKVTETYIPVGNARCVIRYDVQKNRKKVHYLLTIEKRRQAYVRVKDQSIRASKEMCEIIKRAERKRNIAFRYGEHEKFLMEYLDENHSITLNQFMELCKLKRFYASRKLILLVLANVLRITPHEKGDVYSLAF